MNCQVCQKYGAGICETAEDNGVSMECPPDLNACWYIYEGKELKIVKIFIKTKFFKHQITEVRDEIIIIRQCGTDLGESNCVTESEGDVSDYSDIL